MYHCGRYHIISVTYTNHVRIWNIGSDNRVRIGAIAIIGDGYITQIVGHGVIHLDIIRIPLPTGTTTCLYITIEGRHRILRVIHQFIQIKIIMRVGQRHGHIAKFIEQVLEAGTPFRC